MKIIITGGAGMSGSNLIKLLHEKKYDLFVIDNLWRGKLENISDKISDKNFFNKDLSKISDINFLSNIDSLKGADILIHLADIVAGIDYVFKNEYDIFKINNLINTNTFFLSEKLGIKKVIYAGTACSFPQEKQGSLDSKLNDIDLFPANPESGYGWSKLVGQMELEYMVKSKLIDCGITLMFHNVYGPYCEFGSDRDQFIPATIYKLINSQDTISVWGSGNQGRSFVYSEDIAKSIYQAVIKNFEGYKMCQISDYRCYSIKEIVERLIKIHNKNVSIEFDLTKPEGDKGRYGEIKTAQDFLDWNAETSIDVGLKKTYDFIKDRL